MDYLKINKESWNKRTEIHVASKFYDVDRFLQGNTSLQDIELRELGPVAGKTLLHLQCHFGLDTLSWARLGAKVTGVDLSSTAIDKANLLAKQTALDARFICSDLYSFGENSTEQYDVVFTSYGALCWLPDLAHWANVVARSLKPGGTFYIAEFHPFHDVLSGYSYFHNLTPDIEEEGTYTENDPGDTQTVITWAHPLSEVICALIQAGIQIEQFNEYPYSPYNCFDGMTERETGKFYLKHLEQDIPLVYTITGTKGA
ncbi:class I SAM-dependent methyltransferase [Neiella marina]|uniref:Class I SAM-dependent methyltransferase n=1 Tax=Neiella holothuriorum TaxID=2870530 RepID=A0ABS7ECY6_9GAMM|nr:class I SAM-dependent methyltransferase [Neiella holothuriorum]MBW8190180.1 class I SAM-dependent methyltransferase [Neiella holothuriorum]